MGIQKVIGLFPAGLAFSLNEASVRLVRGQVQQRFDTVERANKGLANLRTLQEDVGFCMRGACVLELGTGWHGVDIILFHLLGASRIITVDHWPHLHFETMKDQIEAIHTQRESFDFDLFGATQEIYERLDTLAQAAPKCESLADLLTALKVSSYEIAKSCSVTDLNLPKEGIDLFYTESVLQRIPEESLARSLNHVGQHLLSSEGAFFTRTDQKDIHTQEHVNSGATGFEYLGYSDWLWNLLSSEKLNYQNRLRESDFVKLFEASGMRVVKVHSTVEESDIDHLREMKLASRFQGYDPRDLAVKASIYVGRKDSTGACAASAE